MHSTCELQGTTFPKKLSKRAGALRTPERFVSVSLEDPLPVGQSRNTNAEACRATLNTPGKRKKRAKAAIRLEHKQHSGVAPTSAVRRGHRGKSKQRSASSLDSRAQEESSGAYAVNASRKNTKKKKQRTQKHRRGTLKWPLARRFQWSVRQKLQEKPFSCFLSFYLGSRRFDVIDDAFGDVTCPGRAASDAKLGSPNAQPLELSD